MDTKLLNGGEIFVQVKGQKIFCKIKQSHLM